MPAEARKYDDIIESGYIEIAVYKDFPPYSFQQHSQPQGIDVEIAKLIARELGVEPRWFWVIADENLDDDLRNSIWKGHYIHRRIADLMMRVPYDPDYSRYVDGYGQMRNEMVVMFGPYHQESWSIARDTEVTGDSRTLANFQYDPIGVEIDTLPDIFLTSTFGGRLRQKVRHFPDIFQAVDALNQGKLAAVSGTRSQLQWALKDQPGRYNMSADGLSGIGKSSWDIGMAVRHDFRQLSYTVEEIVARLIQNGSIADIFEKHEVTYQKPSFYQN